MYENISLTDLSELYHDQTLHFQNRVNDISVQSDPFEHFELDDVFSKEFYNYLKWLMPAGEGLRSLREHNAVSQAYSPERYALFIKSNHTAYSGVNEFTNNHALSQQYIKLHKWIAKVFFPVIAEKLEVPLPYITHDELLYVVDRTGYEFPPHTDSKTKVISVLFYMPDTDLHPERGTHILKPKNNKFQDPNNHGGHSMQLFDICKTSKFVPNNMLAFKRCDYSFHSVSKLEDNNERKLLMYTASHYNFK